MGIVVIGLNELVAGFLAEAARAKQHAQESVRTAAEAIAAEARSRAPRLTGALADSISADVDGTKAEVGPEVPYAPFVEYGTATQAPQPFMGPAADTHEDDLETELANRVGEL